MIKCYSVMQLHLKYVSSRVWRGNQEHNLSKTKWPEMARKLYQVTSAVMLHDFPKAYITTPLASG